jgi:hypothetical protein
MQNVVFKAGETWLARTSSNLEELFKGSRAYADVSNCSLQCIYFA